MKSFTEATPHASERWPNRANLSSGSIGSAADGSLRRAHWLRLLPNMAFMLNLFEGRAFVTPGSPSEETVGIIPFGGLVEIEAIHPALRGGDIDRIVEALEQRRGTRDSHIGQ